MYGWTVKKEESRTVYLFSLPCLFLCLYGRTEKCELSIRWRGWGDVEGERERGRDGERELEGGGQTHDTVRGEEKRKMRQRGDGRERGRTGNLKRGEQDR